MICIMSVVLRYLMLITIEKLDGRPVIFRARSEDGFFFEIEREPFIASSTDVDFKVYEEMRVLDARITALNDEFYVVYLAMGRHGIVLDLGKTKDFKEFERLEIVSQPGTKAGALFPRKTNGRFALLEKPRYGESIWIAYSNDLLTWDEREVVLTPMAGFWDQGRIGCAVPPMETESWFYGDSSRSIHSIRLFLQSDLVVLSYIKGAQSGIMAQCFAFNKPVITSNLLAFRKLVKRSNGGLICKSNKEYIQNIIKILRDDDLYRTLQNNIKEYVKNYSSWMIIAQQHIKVYQSVVRIPYGRAKYVYWEEEK